MAGGSQRKRQVKQYVRREMIFHGNKRYHYRYTNKSTIQYRCAIRSCTGRILKTISTGKITVTAEHCCGVDVQPPDCQADQFTDELKAYALKHPLTPALEVVETIQGKFANDPELLARIPDTKILVRKIRRWRKPKDESEMEAREEALNKLRELTWATAGKVADAAAIVRQFLQEMPASSRSCLPSKDHLILRVKSFAREKGIPLLPSSSKKPFHTLQLVDEDGKSLGDVPLDHLLFGATTPKPIIQNPSVPVVAGTSTLVPSREQKIESDLGQGESSAFLHDDDDGAADDDFLPGDGTFDEGEGEEVGNRLWTNANTAKPVAEKIAKPASKRKSTIVKTSSNGNGVSHQFKKNVVKSGERCFVCGDELVISESLASSEETFRKACCYLNVKFGNDWFPSTSGGSYSFCEPCTTEVKRIHQLYKKVEEIQALIFKKVENVEKTIADAEIVDYWMASAPPTSVRRFEGFRKQVLINYTNKLKLRREIRLGKKMGVNFTEILPAPSSHMFASNPSDTEAFNKSKEAEICHDNEEINRLEEDVVEKQPNVATSTKRRGRPPKAKTDECSSTSADARSLTTMEQEVDTSLNDDFGDFHGDDYSGDDAASVTSEKETKFWEDDPSKLRIEPKPTASASNAKKRNDDDSSDPDYDVNEDDDDEDWSETRNRRSKRVKSSGNGIGRRGRGRPPSSSKTVEKVPEENMESAPDSPIVQHDEESQAAAPVQIPDAVLTKEGRIFVSGIEVIKNKPGLILGRPYSVSFTCTACNITIQSFLTMRNHIRGRHLPESSRCEICGWEGEDIKQLYHHRQKKHSKASKIVVPCPICEKPVQTFGKERVMHYHMWSHLNKAERADPQYHHWCHPSRRKEFGIGVDGDGSAETFMCSFCSRIFSKKHALALHEKTHNKDGTTQSRPPVQCQFCGRIYQTKKALWGHNVKCGKPKTELAGYRYPCSKCEKVFSSRATRSKHMKRFHTPKNLGPAAMPYSCPKCHKRFATKTGCHTHKRICVEGHVAGNLKSGKWRVIPARSNDEPVTEPQPSTSASEVSESREINTQPGYSYSNDSVPGSSTMTDSSASLSFGGFGMPGYFHGGGNIQ